MDVRGPGAGLIYFAIKQASNDGASSRNKPNDNLPAMDCRDWVIHKNVYYNGG